MAVVGDGCAVCLPHLAKQLHDGRVLGGFGNFGCIQLDFSCPQVQRTASALAGVLNTLATTFLCCAPPCYVRTETTKPLHQGVNWEVTSLTDKSSRSGEPTQVT